MLLAGATLNNSREYQVTGRHKVKILQIFKENPTYMTVALVGACADGARYRCDIWSDSCRLEVGNIVCVRFIGLKEDCENIYEVDIQPRYERGAD